MADIKALKSGGINIYGVDINSKFETEPGKKDICKVLEFTNKLKRIKDSKIKD